MALQSGGIRFYDADHVIEHNYIDGTTGTGFQDPLILDTGDAEGSSTNLSAHWRVVGARVQRNVLVDVPRGITIGDNYSLVPRDCTVTDNVVVDADTPGAIVQRVAPSNSVIEPNQYFSSTSAAEMTVGADTIARKPGYGPRLTFLTAADVGPSAAGTLDGEFDTGEEIDGPVATPGDVLNIGTGANQNHFQLTYAEDEAEDVTTVTLNELAAGFYDGPYFTVVTNTIDGVEVPAVQFRVRADSATTSGSTTPRCELRETRADGTTMGFDAMVGDHSLRTTVRITHLPEDDPEVVVAQLHSNVNSERISLRTQSVSGETKLLVRINGSEALRLSESYEVGDEVQIEFRVRDGGIAEVYVGGSTEPNAVGQLVSTGAAEWHWRVGAWAQFNADSVDDDTDYVAVEHRDLRVTHENVAGVDVGADIVAVIGQQIARQAIERGLTGVTSRRWTIVARPVAPEEPGPGPGPQPDLTTAAARHNWGTPHPMSDEFNYNGAPDPAKWKLPGDNWAGHQGNGRRRPERQVCDGSKLIMTGLANGDTGWMQHRMDREYGRFEIRLRSFNNGSSNGNLYHPVILIWPQSNSRRADGEYDFCENGRPGDTKAQAFMHFPGDGDQQRHFEIQGAVDHTKFNNWGFEWTPTHLAGFLNGEQWFITSGGANSSRRNIQAMGPGHLCIQLDNFNGTNQTPASLEVEWVRFYDI